MLYLIRKGEKVIGIFDNITTFFTDFNSSDGGEIPETYKNYTIEKLELNEVMIKPNQIIFKGKQFTVNNIDEPLPLLDVTDPTFL